jgi:hypothetical protein
MVADTPGSTGMLVAAGDGQRLNKMGLPALTRGSELLAES